MPLCLRQNILLSINMKIFTFANDISTPLLAICCFIAYAQAGVLMVTLKQRAYMNFLSLKNYPFLLYTKNSLYLSNRNGFITYLS